MSSSPTIRVENLKVHFPVRRGLLALPGAPQQVVRAVDGVSFDIHPGEILAMVGESGCGKTTVGKTLLRLIEPTDGKIWFRNTDMTALRKHELRRLREKIQLIFQDPYESLDPRQSIFDIVAEPLRIHHHELPRAELEAKVYGGLESAGLRPAHEIARRFPHHLSGGQRQRVAIAAAMALEPDFLVTDEPVSMLDVSIRAEILQLMLNLRAKNHLCYLFITHDLSLAWSIADRIVVLYLGKIVEIGSANAVIHESRHPYTRALVSVIPSPSPTSRPRFVLTGETPSPIRIPEGCRFRPRCWLYQRLGKPEECVRREPELKPVGNHHNVACHFDEGVVQYGHGT